MPVNQSALRRYLDKWSVHFGLKRQGREECGSPADEERIRVRREHRVPLSVDGPVARGRGVTELEAYSPAGREGAQRPQLPIAGAKPRQTESTFLVGFYFVRAPPELDRRLKVRAQVWPGENPR